MLFGLVASLFLAGTAQAQSNTYTSMAVKITGVKQSWIKGGLVQRGREGLIQGLGFKLISGRTNAGNTAVGSSLQLGLAEFTKPVDKSTPLLQKALGENEVLSKVEFTFYGNRLGTATGAAGAEFALYTVVLTNARVVSIQDAFTPGSTANPNNFQQTIGLSYEKIEWTWMDGGIMHMESTNVPK
jgi:type VI secretion system secreted protein Hcp